MPSSSDRREFTSAGSTYRDINRQNLLIRMLE